MCVFPTFSRFNHFWIGFLRFLYSAIGASNHVSAVEKTDEPQRFCLKLIKFSPLQVLEFLLIDHRAKFRSPIK